ncbi:hypothetical protein GOP47_0010990 [Adiantum capillus-veneris]|uniref:DUF4408 domain-containing protein n=1 Tax=Adiantum capillus-veneris TaxID=13818 RepID=A0A9D4UWA5_ADICA|nr:hypothetical protein GOP47_0010990 [Adiantum capillus-veneris]
MSMESEYEEGGAEEGGRAELSRAGKVAIMVGSLGVASVVGVYVHPHLLPLASEGVVPQLWQAAQGWMTAPILFLLLNVVVGTLYVTKRVSPPELEAEIGREPAPASRDQQLSPERAAEPPEPIKPASAKGLRARFEKSRTLSRLVRSKSEQIPPISAKAEASRLKKAGTFETTPRSRPVIVVADPPEDAPSAGHEEVDKKAEDFISRFYHKVKLQRLDSLLRQQQQQQQGRQ